MFLARRRYVERAVFGFKDTIRIDRRMIVAGLTRHIAAAEIALALDAEQADQRAKQRCFHTLTFAGYVALRHERRDSERTPHAGGEIADRHAVACRLAAGCPVRLIMPDMPCAI